MGEKYCSTSDIHQTIEDFRHKRQNIPRLAQQKTKQRKEHQGFTGDEFQTMHDCILSR